MPNWMSLLGPVLGSGAEALDLTLGNAGEALKGKETHAAAEALERVAALYVIEQDAQELKADDRQALRETRVRLLLEDLMAWLLVCRGKIPSGSTSRRVYKEEGLESVLEKLCASDEPILNCRNVN